MRHPTDDGLGDMLADGPDPGGYLRMNLYDLLINNTEDQHCKNLVIDWLVANTEEAADPILSVKKGRK